MLGNRAAAGGGPGGPKDCAQDVKNWWTNCPYFFKFLFITQFVLFIFSIINFGLFQNLLVNVPYRTVFRFFFWTPATAFIVPKGFFDVLIGLYLTYNYGKRIELQIGTIHYIIEMVFKNFLIQVGYTLIMFIGSFILSDSLLLIPGQGLFPTFMLLLTLRGLADPEQETPFCCFPVMVKQKYYPWILYGIFCLLGGSLAPEILCAIGVAYLEVKMFNGQILKIEKPSLARYEQKFPFKFINNRADFITTDKAGIESLDIEQPQQQQQEQQQPQFNAFAGRGVSIGQGQAGQPQSILSQQPPQVVINPSQSSGNQTQDELRRAAAEAAMARFESNNEQDNQQQQDSSEGDIDKLPDKYAQVNQDEQKQEQKTKKGYDQLNEEQLQEELL